MEERTYLKGVTVRDLVEGDAEKLKGLNVRFMLEEGYKVFECGDLWCVVSRYDFEKFGRERLCDVAYKVHDDFFNDDYLRVDFEKIANDPEFNKPLEIPVKYVKDIYGTNERLFKGENGKYYIRQDNPREHCAVWVSAFKHKGNWTDNAPIRANVTFVMGEERETVRYSNWAGSGVFNEGYNKAFAGGLDSRLEAARTEAKEVRTLDVGFDREASL